MYVHGLRTPNEGINQRNLKIWADMADKIRLRPYLKIWEWELIFGRAVKAISSPGVRSPCYYISDLSFLELGKSSSIMPPIGIPRCTQSARTT